MEAVKTELSVAVDFMNFAGGFVITDRELSADDKRRIREKYVEVGHDYQRVQEWVDKGMPEDRLYLGLITGGAMPTEMLLTFEEQLAQLLREHYRKTGNQVERIGTKWYTVGIGQDDILAAIDVGYTATVKQRRSDA